jgi:hypothetical protein
MPVAWAAGRDYRIMRGADGPTKIPSLMAFAIVTNEREEEGAGYHPDALWPNGKLCAVDHTTSPEPFQTGMKMSARYR